MLPSILNFYMKDQSSQLN